jgi:hypothetical protein
MMTTVYDTQLYPLKCGELHIEEIGHEIVVYDSSVGAFHLLNQTAFVILKNCTGALSLHDIALTLCQETGCDDLETIFADVCETVKELEANHLVIPIRDIAHNGHSNSIEPPSGQLIAVALTGTSMFPFLLNGDKAVLKVMHFQELRPGDIIAWYDNQSTLIAHRITSIFSEDGVVVTKGDLCLELDPPVSADRVLGKVIAILRDGQLQWVENCTPAPANSQDGEGLDGPPSSELKAQPDRKGQIEGMQVLDLRDLPSSAFALLKTVKDVHLVLVSANNREAWEQVPSHAIDTVLTVPEGYRVYTGQPELFPSLLTELSEPLSLLIVGQLFLSSFTPLQLTHLFKHLIVAGQVYVNSQEAKDALACLTTVAHGEIFVVPGDHTRWIGPSLLGQESLNMIATQPLISIGDLRVVSSVTTMPPEIAVYAKHRAVSLVTTLTTGDALMGYCTIRPSAQ